MTGGEGEAFEESKSYSRQREEEREDSKQHHGHGTAEGHQANLKSRTQAHQCSSRGPTVQMGLKLSVHSTKWMVDYAKWTGPAAASPLPHQHLAPAWRGA